MKKMNLLLTVVLIILTSFTLNAQVQPDFFAGKWNVLIQGTPNGDMKTIMSLEREEGKLTGTISFGEFGTITFSNIEEKDGESITAYFESNGYDIYLFLEKKSDDNLEGSMLDMFDAKAKRAKNN
jgi:hypothetical protein